MATREITGLQGPMDESKFIDAVQRLERGFIDENDELKSIVENELFGGLIDIQIAESQWQRFVQNDAQHLMQYALEESLAVWLKTV